MQVFQIETFADGADCLSKSVTSGRRFVLQLLQIEMIGWDGPSANQLSSSVTKCHTFLSVLDTPRGYGCIVSAG